MEKTWFVNTTELYSYKLLQRLKPFSVRTPIVNKLTRRQTTTFVIKTSLSTSPIYILVPTEKYIFISTVKYFFTIEVSPFSLLEVFNVPIKVGFVSYMVSDAFYLESSVDKTTSCVLSRGRVVISFPGSSREGKRGFLILDSIREFDNIGLLCLSKVY